MTIKNATWIAVPLVLICSLLYLFAPIQKQEELGFADLRSEELFCTIGNNSETGIHRSGYNGVFKLTSVHQKESLFVPQIAGLNLEHVFDGSSRGVDRDIFFEPRRAPMEFKVLDEQTVVLHQPPLPVWKVESTTTFRLVDPYYIDVSFECVPHADHFEGGAFGLFWASYINGPLDKSVYFLRADANGNRLWQQFSTQYHNHDSTVKHAEDSFTWKFAPEAPNSLFSNISDIRYAEPFFYGQFRNMVFIVIFDEADGVRFSHSPSGGGVTPGGDDTNPAWDFQWVIPDYQVGTKYQFNYRVVYKKWEGRADVLAEVAKFRK